MSEPAVGLPTLQSINATASFNRWAGLSVAAVEHGRVELQMPWRDEFGQYAGALHAGVVSALVDTACGFAAATVTGAEVTASHCSVSFLARRGGRRSSPAPTS